MAAAAMEEVQTELASRVAGWRTKIAPVLEEQDARGDFDIHMCGSHASESPACCLQGLAVKTPMRHCTAAGSLSPRTMRQAQHACMRKNASAERFCELHQCVVCCMPHEAVAA